MEIKKILIIRLSAIGDTIHTLPAVFALRKNFPNAQIDWIVEDKASVFVKNNPLIDNVYIINRKKFSIKSFFKLILKIRKEKYDAALDFQQLFKSGLILGLSAAKRRIMLDCAREFSFLFANETIKTSKKLFDINYHVVNRNLDLVRALGGNFQNIKFILPDFTKEYSETIKNIVKSLNKEKKTIIFAPATTWANKHWSIENWRCLINEFKNDFNIIITASEREKELTSKILANIKQDNITDLTGKTALADLVYIFQNADCVVSPDSGSAHIAWAAGAKSIVTLFFATSAKRTAPFAHQYFSISADVDCSPCMKKKCKLKSNKYKCINSINTKQVIQCIHKAVNLQDVR